MNFDMAQVTVIDMAPMGFDQKISFLFAHFLFIVAAKCGISLNLPS